MLLYWLDAEDVTKQQMARKWVLAVWEAGQGRVKFYSNAADKLRAPVREARAMIEVFVQLTAGSISRKSVVPGIGWTPRHLLLGCFDLSVGRVRWMLVFA